MRQPYKDRGLRVSRGCFTKRLFRRLRGASNATPAACGEGAQAVISSYIRRARGQEDRRRCPPQQSRQHGSCADRSGDPRNIQNPYSVGGQRRRARALTFLAQLMAQELGANTNSHTWLVPLFSSILNFSVFPTYALGHTSRRPPY